MAKSVANVVIATDSFATLVGITNQLADAVSTVVMTANSSADGANTTGNSFLIGVLSANTIAVPTSLRGGFVNAAANLNITSNVVFDGTTNFVNANTVSNSATHTITSATTTLAGGTLVISSNATFNANATFSGNKVTVGSNSTISGSNAYVNSATFTVESNTVVLGGNTLTISANTINITGNTTFSIGYPTFSDTANFANAIIIGTDLTMKLASNSDIGSNTTTPQTVFAIPKADFKSAKITAQVCGGR